MYWQKINSNDEVIGVCRPYNFVRTAKLQHFFKQTNNENIFFIVIFTHIISIFLMTFNTPQYALPVISAICSELIVLFSPFSPSIGTNLLKFSISLRYKINIVPRWRFSHFRLRGFILTDCSRWGIEPHCAIIHSCFPPLYYPRLESYKNKVS